MASQVGDDMRPFSVNSVSDIAIEVTDEELKKLAESFAKGREELQKKIDSLILDLPRERPDSTVSLKRSPRYKNDFFTDKTKTGGIPITMEQAIRLREITVSSCVHHLSSDWKKAKLVFRDRESELPYGLISEKNGTKGFILAIQANIVKLMIDKSYQGADPNSRIEKIILRPTEIEKKQLLVESLANMLWNAGEKRHACVVLNRQVTCFAWDKNNKSKEAYYTADGITEKLNLYDFKDLPALITFIRTNISHFQKAEGCIVFLYSLILSRQFNQLKQDLQGTKLLGDMEECTIALFNLACNGVACPYLHNNSVYYDASGEPLSYARVGLTSRCNIGILYWDSKEDDKRRTEVESMLKVPKYPIWIAVMGQNKLALLFNLNIALMSDWKLERNFNLYFYSPLLKQEHEHKLNIDTREEYFDAKRALQDKYQSMQFMDEEKEIEIEKAIQTKWPGCQMTGTDTLMSLL